MCFSVNRGHNCSINQSLKSSALQLPSNNRAAMKVSSNRAAIRSMPNSLHTRSTVIGQLVVEMMVKTKGVRQLATKAFAILLRVSAFGTLRHISQPVEDRIRLGPTQQMMSDFKHRFKHFTPIEPPVKDNQSTGNVSAYPL